MLRCLAALLLLPLAGCGSTQTTASTTDPSTKGRRSTARWEALWKQCENGDVGSCTEAAAWLQGDPRLWPEEIAIGAPQPPTDPERALLALSRACNAGDLAACDWIVGRQLQHWPDRLTPIARHKLARDCESGDEVSCVLAADALAESSPTQAASLLGSGCRNDSREACAELGGLYERGRGVTRDLPKARELYASACGPPEYHGCVPLAQMLWKGKGGRRDRDRARRLLSKVCNHDLARPNHGFAPNWPESCVVLEALTGQRPR